MDDPSKILLIDLTRHMTKLRIGSRAGGTGTGQRLNNGGRLNTVVAETGATMDALFRFSEENNLGLVMAPIIGQDATIGGVLAIGGHGAGIPALNEKLQGPGYTFGSVSNTILEFKAIVWNNRTNRYLVQTFTRSNPDTAAFIVHVGRAIITEVTLMVGPNYNYRCVSYTNIPGRELFAHPANSRGLRTFTSFMDDVGRVDVIWYPFVQSPWLKIWSVEENKPRNSTFIDEPYPYQFDSTFLNPQTPGTVFGPLSLERLERGLTQDNRWDIWGRSKNTILHYNRTTTPLSYSGYVVLTNRANVQLVLHEISEFYLKLLDEYGARGIYPIDNYIKLRVTGLDDPRETGVNGAVGPLISPTSPMPSRPDFDSGVWMNTLTTTGRPYSDEFMRKMEDFAYLRFNGNDAIVRPEWSKNWGHSDAAPFGNQYFLKNTIPQVFGVQEWNRAIAILDKYDPHQVISNSFLRELMVPYGGRGPLAITQGTSIQVAGFGWNK
ncbi:unnamed protein product [Orchesella dallaii]